MTPNGGIARRIGSWNRSDLRALAVCILIAGLIWLLRSLTDEARDTFEIHVTYTLENQYIEFIELNQEFIEVEVSSSGFGILGQRYFKRDEPLLVDLNRAGISKGRIAIGTVSLRPQLIRSIGNDREIISIRPDSIIAMVSPNGTKTVEVEPIYSLADPENQHLIEKPKVNPSYIQVSGPEIFLDTLSKIYTSPFLCDANRSSKVPLSVPKNIQAEKDAVDASWELDILKLTTRKVKIELVGDTSNMDIRFFPPTTEVSYTSSNSIEELLAEDPFVVSVDAATIIELVSKGKQKVDVEIENVPEGVKDLSLSPGRVEFLLMR